MTPPTGMVRTAVLATALCCACSKSEAPPKDEARAEPRDQGDVTAAKAEPRPPLPDVSPLPGDAIVERVLAVNAHVTVLATGGPFTDHERIAALALESPQVVAAQPIQIAEAVRPGDGGEPLLLEGVDPARWREVLDVPDYLVAGSAELAWRDRDQPPPAIVGQALAASLELEPGDTLELAIALAADGSPAAQRFRVVGLVRTQMKPYDSGLVLTSLAAVQRSASSPGVTAVELRIREPSAAAEVARTLGPTLGSGYQVLSWCELNRALLAELCAATPADARGASASCQCEPTAQPRATPGAAEAQLRTDPVLDSA